MQDHCPLLDKGNNCGHIAMASYAAILIDYENYFSALHEAIVQARHSIFLMGWDLDSRTKLLRGETAAASEFPVKFFDLIQWKARQCPDMKIYLNRWDYSLFVSEGKEWLARWRWWRHSPGNLHYIQDETTPMGASHHQKVVVIDDEIAFCGGMDVALKRWDGREHMPRNHHRIDPAALDGAPVVFEPYHDTQMLVAGDAARELAGLIRQRWFSATGNVPVPLREIRGNGDLPHTWPSGVNVDFENVRIGIALTIPQWFSKKAHYQIKRLYLDMITRAERFIYIENQFLCHLDVARVLNRRLRQNPQLQVLIVSSFDPNGLMEQKAMWNGRVHFRDILESGDVTDRVVMAYPVSRVDGVEKPVRIHSKLMVVDDRYFRIGSSNINNRSLCMDTECDLLLEVETDADRETVAGIRNDLIREHTGYEKEIIEEVARGKREVTFLLNYLGHSRQHLYKINDERYRHVRFSGLAKMLVDPLTFPFTAKASLAFAKVRVTRLLLVVVCIVALGLLWKITPLAEYTAPGKIVPLLEQVRATPWAVPAAMLVYTVGTLAFFPHMAMTGTIVIVFAPVQAFSIAMTGSIVSGAIGFWIGRRLGLKSLRALAGEAAEKVSLYAKKGGIMGITLLRLLPIAPYTVVNLALGMLEVSFAAFIVGTFLGTLPGTLIAALLGHSVLELWKNPDGGHVGAILFGLLCWVGVVVLSHTAARRWKKRWRKTA